MFTSDEIRNSMRLYAVTDRACLKGRSLSASVKDALLGGATCIQLREKETESADFELLARAVKPLCTEARVPLIVNDDVALAGRIGADGVHIGQDDMTCEAARDMLGSHAIIGVSVQTLDQAQRAQRSGADYLGVGAMFGTPTKPDAAEVNFGVLRQIVESVSIPVVVIGGINAQTISQFADVDIDGFAVVSAIFAADDIKDATRNLLQHVNKVL